MVRQLVLSLIAVLCAGLLGSTAQNRAVSGKVSGTDGAPIAGATVIVEGTSAGTTTGADGSFTLAAPADASLLVSFLGYETASVPVAGKT
ncbi:carboxypeptidase-like regulatory domain-containing protein, partial [uncultured Alistipes sp.]|uniref:carboxypeptidase-like regulatory domain-containing protein n=2 Tax=uncultured Alistipes sp. TaxID=538949 RepID=UPI00272B9A1E